MQLRWLGYLSLLAAGAAIAFGAVNADRIKQKATEIVSAYRQCASDYPHLKQTGNPDNPMKYLPPDTVVRCEYIGKFRGDDERQKVGIAVVAEDSVHNDREFKKGQAFLYALELDKPKSEKAQKVGAIERLEQKGVSLKKFRMANLGIDSFPQPVIEYRNSEGGGIKVFLYSPEYIGSESISYTLVANVQAKGFQFADLDSDGGKELIATIVRTGSGTKPIAIFSFMRGITHRLDHRYVEFPAVEETKQRLAQAVEKRDATGIARIRSSANPHVFASAFDNLFAEMARANSLDTNRFYQELFGMEQTPFVNMLLTDPAAKFDKIVLAGAFIERLRHHIEEGYNKKYSMREEPAVGYSFVFEDQTHFARSREEAKQEIARLERRKQEEASMPTVYHPFEERKSYPGGGSIKRGVEVGGPPKTPQQREIERGLKEDPVYQTGKRAYERAGALKGDAERAGKEAYERAGALKGDVERGIKEFVESLSKQGKKK